MPSRLRLMLSGVESTVRHLPRGAAVDIGETARRYLVFVDDGWAMKVADTEDGRRQTLRFILPGDCARCDVLCSDLIEGTSIECITPCRMTYVDMNAMWERMSAHPKALRTVVDELGELASDAECYVTMLGTYTAEERLAWMLLHLYTRASRAGLAVDGRIAFPVTQSQLASALGLSLVHTNKTLARLRAAGLVRWTGGDLEILAAKGLGAVGRFR